MTYYHPCIECKTDRTSCQYLGEIKKALAGLCITSVKFNCPDRQPNYCIGDRILVTLKVAEEFADLGFEFVVFKATIIDEPKGRRYPIKIDDGPSTDWGDEYIAPDCLLGNGFAKAISSNIEPLDEPRTFVCQACQSVEVTGFKECFSDNLVHQSKCLKASHEKDRNECNVFRIDNK